eukprot:SAG22_NODE_6199_length_887_cov_0.939086_2_plen_177_part_01
MNGIPYAKEIVEIVVELSQMSYDDTAEDPCAVPSCPPFLATFTTQWRFVAIGFVQPVAMACIVITMMFLWNWSVSSRTLVGIGRMTGQCCKTRHDIELPPSLLNVSGVPIIHLLHDGTTRLPESEIERTKGRGHHCQWLVGRREGVCCKSFKRVFQMDLHLEPSLTFTGAPNGSATA